MMLTALFLAWLQMSAQPQVSFPPAGHVACYQGASNPFIWSCVDSAGTPMCLKPLYEGSDKAVPGYCPLPLDDITRADFAEAAQRAADETDGKPPEKWGDAGNGGGKPGTAYVCYPGHDEDARCSKDPAEPVDVPAVQVVRKSVDKACADHLVIPQDMSRKQAEEIVCTANFVDKVQIDQTCADKSRILEHDENSPPKYWCRKVQP